MRHRRPKLRHGNFDHQHAVVGPQQCLGNDSGQMFEKLGSTSSHNLGHHVTEGPVVDGVSQVVR